MQRPVATRGVVDPERRPGAQCPRSLPRPTDPLGFGAEAADPAGPRHFEISDRIARGTADVLPVIFTGTSV